MTPASETEKRHLTQALGGNLITDERLRLRFAWWSIGRLGPCALLLWVLLELGLYVAGGPHIGAVNQAIRHFRAHSPFSPNLKLEETFIGEAAREANVRPLEAVRRMRFSSNNLGFRTNPEYPNSEPPDVLVLGGTSFTYGAALSDKETFSAALTRVSGLKAFNAGRFHLDADGLPELDWLLERLPSHPRTAIFVYLEHQILAGRDGTIGRLAELRRTHPELNSNIWNVRRIVQVWGRMSPLEIITQRFFKSLKDDRILPNPHRKKVRTLTLPDTDPMLIRDYELFPASWNRGQAQARSYTEYLEWYRQQLAARGMETLVVIIPTRYTVYAPVTERDDSRRAGAIAARDFLYMLEDVLTERGIRTVNAMRIFEQSRQRELETCELSFFRDDNHWNPRGVELVASAVAEALRTGVSRMHGAAAVRQEQSD